MFSSFLQSLNLACFSLVEVRKYVVLHRPRVGSKPFETSRVGSGRVGSGRVRSEGFSTLTQWVGLLSLDLTREALPDS